MTKAQSAERPILWRVSELSFYIQLLLEEDEKLVSLQVQGEIANFHAHKPSGHYYFNLTEKDASIQCVLFKGTNLDIPFQMENGIEIIAEGRIATYAPRSQYQLRVSGVKPAGVGTLYQAFEKLKSKLAKEGLFEERFKKSLPRYPQVIGVVTSPVGAAIKDITENLKKRFPLATLLLSPAAVQGTGASRSIERALKRLLLRREIEVIILARGGGSFEELFVFNDEGLARTIFSSPIPIVTGIGHQKDFTIADFVADKRASTPSQAVQVCVPDKEEVLSYLISLRRRLQKHSNQRLQEKTHRLERAARSAVFHRIQGFIDFKKQQIDETLSRIQRISRRTIEIFKERLENKTKKLRVGIPRNLRSREEKLKVLKRQLTSLSPSAVLKRGFSLCLSRDKSRIIKSIHEVNLEDQIWTRLVNGSVSSVVREKEGVSNE